MTYKEEDFSILFIGDDYEEGSEEFEDNPGKDEEDKESEEDKEKIYEDEFEED